MCFLLTRLQMLSGGWPRMRALCNVPPFDSEPYYWGITLHSLAFRAEILALSVCPHACRVVLPQFLAGDDRWERKSLNGPSCRIPTPDRVTVSQVGGKPMDAGGTGVMWRRSRSALKQAEMIMPINSRSSLYGARLNRALVSVENKRRPLPTGDKRTIAEESALSPAAARKSEKCSLRVLRANSCGERLWRTFASNVRDQRLRTN
ncbi:unnamed protein product, partial [Iphiclides podalirius]